MKKLFLKTGTFVLTALTACACLVGCKPNKPSSGTTKTIENVTANGVTVLVGKTVALQIENLQEGDKVSYSTDNKSFVEMPVSYSEEGTYTLYYKIVRKGYKDFTSSVQVEVVGANSLFTVDGDTLTIGVYPRALSKNAGSAETEKAVATPYDAVTLNGVQIVAGNSYDFAVEEVEWTIVETTANGYVAVSKEIIDVTPYAPTYTATTFDESALQAKIATIYEKMFVGLEKEICSVSVMDAEFVSSLGANANEILQAKASDYAVALGCWTSDLASYAGNGVYWLKNLATDARYAQFVDFNGKVNADGYMVHAPYYGVRLVVTIAW